MDIDIKTIQKVTVVAISGELDGRTAPLAQEQIVPLYQPGSKMIELQDTMSATGFLAYFTTCDTLDAGIAALQ